MRTFLGTLAALVVWSAGGAGQWSRVAVVVALVVAGAGLELVVGLVRRKLRAATPPRPRPS